MNCSVHKKFKEFFNDYDEFMDSIKRRMQNNIARELNIDIWNEKTTEKYIADK